MSMLAKMGQTPFHFPAPNGYPDTGLDWLNSNDLINRWNFALGLAGDFFEDTKTDWRNLSEGSAWTDDSFDVLCMNLLGSVPAGEARGTILRVASLVTDADPFAFAGALLLASPYFQYR